MEITTLFFDTEEELQAQKDFFEHLGVAFEVVNIDGKDGITYDLDALKARLDKGVNLDNIKPQKPTKSSLFDRYNQIPKWGRFVIGAFSVLIVVGLFSGGLTNPETEIDSSQSTELLIDAKAAFNASPEYFAQLLGQPTSTEESQSKWACGKEHCLHNSYQDGKYEVYFRDDKAVQISVKVDNDQVDESMIKNLGLSVSSPDKFTEDAADSSKGIMDWYDKDGMMVTINSVVYSIRDLNYLPKDLKEASTW